MAPEFGGEVATRYSKYRRGYDPCVIDWLADWFALDGESIVIDLGCGTGQLAVPISARVQAVVGIDPEPEMLAYAAAEAARHGYTNISWMLGSADDLPALQALLGGHSSSSSEFRRHSDRPQHSPSTLSSRRLRVACRV